MSNVVLFPTGTPYDAAPAARPLLGGIVVSPQETEYALQYFDGLIPFASWPRSMHDKIMQLVKVLEVARS